MVSYFTSSWITWKSFGSVDYLPEQKHTITSAMLVSVLSSSPQSRMKEWKEEKTVLDKEHVKFYLFAWEEGVNSALRFTLLSMVCARPSINQSSLFPPFFFPGTHCRNIMPRILFKSTTPLCQANSSNPPPKAPLKTPPPPLPKKGPSELVLLMYSQTKLGALTPGEVHELVAAMHWIKDTISDSNQIRAHTHTCKSPLSNQFYKGPSAEIH